jgi:hypothetical protein
MRFCCLVIALTFLAVSASGSWGQSHKPSSGGGKDSQTIKGKSSGAQQPTAPDQRSTKEQPSVVDVIKPPGETERNAERDEHKSDWWLNFYTAAVALFTFLLFSATVVQIVIFLRQLRLIRQSLGPAEDAAKAARGAADVARESLTKLEQPFVGIEIVSVGLSVKDPKSDPHVKLDDDLKFRFANYGRTPATITELFDEFHVCEPNEVRAPINPEGGGIEFPFGVIVGANRRSPPTRRSQSEGIDQNIWTTFSVGDGELFLIGFVRFRDIFDQRHITGFCLRFDKRGGQFLFDGDERYNYTHREQ